MSGTGCGPDHCLSFTLHRNALLDKYMCRCNIVKFSCEIKRGALFSGRSRQVDFKYQSLLKKKKKKKKKQKTKQKKKHKNKVSSSIFHDEMNTMLYGTDNCPI